MDPISDRSPTSPYGVIRDAQRTVDAGAVRLVDGAAQALDAALAARDGPPPAPIEVPATRGSTIEVIA